MPLNIEELSELEDELLQELPNKLTTILSKLNRCGQLDEFLEMIGMKHLLESENELYTYKDGKIVVIGGSDVKEEVLVSIGKSLEIDKNRFEFCLDYNQIQKYNFKKMKYNPKYRIILFGPTPHSGHGKENDGSIIANIEKSNAYPRTERLISGQELKITKTNFREKLEQLKEENYI